eukprot:5204931-Amphidinium_carterae.1
MQCVWLRHMRATGWHATPEQDVLTSRPRAGPERTVLTSLQSLPWAFVWLLTSPSRVFPRSLCLLRTPNFMSAVSLDLLISLLAENASTPLACMLAFGHFGPSAVEVLHWLAKDAAPRIANDSGQALGLVKLAQTFFT